MKPRPRPKFDQRDLFQAHFDQILNPDHALVVLADQIDWQRFDEALAECYCPDNGAPAKDVRLLVGLHYLKHAFNESDESVVARWIENPYWQYFCGFTTMQHELPLHPTSLVKWRNRVWAETLIALLQETISLAMREKLVSTRELEHVTVDTTVQSTPRCKRRTSHIRQTRSCTTKPFSSWGTLRSLAGFRCGKLTFVWRNGRR